jgi:hypothetical protein
MLFAAEGGRAMLVELSVMEWRYHAVIKVVSGASVSEVARLPPRCARRAKPRSGRRARAPEPRATDEPAFDTHKEEISGVAAVP